MKVQKTGARTIPVFRRLDFPDAGYTRETHAQLEAGEAVEVDERVAHYLISRNIAEEATEIAEE